MDEGVDLDEAARTADLADALGRQAAAAGLRLAVGWTFRFEGGGEGRARAAIERLRARRPNGRVLEHPQGGGLALAWVEGAPPAWLGGEALPPSADERLAAAMRLCDGLLLRLGLPRHLATTLRAADGAAAGAAAPVERREGGWIAGAGPPTVVVRPEGDALRLLTPPVPELDAWLEFVVAAEESAATLGLRLALEGAPPPADDRVEQVAADWSEEGFALRLAPMIHARRRAALLAASLPAGDPGPASAEAALGDLAGAVGALAARPDAAARAVEFWMARPGLARLIGDERSALRRLEARGAATLVELDLALARASGPAPRDARLGALAAALEGSELALDGDARALRLVFRDLRPENAAEAAGVEALLASLVVAAASRGGPARVPRSLAWPRDRFDLPAFLWSDAAAALAELAAEGAPAPVEPLRRLFERRFPVIGRVEGRGARLIVRRAPEASPGARRAEVRIEGGPVDALAVEVEGRIAPLVRCPMAGGRVFGLRVDAPRLGAPPLAAPAAPVGIVVRGEEDERPRLAARLDLAASTPRLEAQAEDPAGRPPARRVDDALQPTTLDLRAQPPSR